jgi:hypothetical protein
VEQDADLLRQAAPFDPEASALDMSFEVGSLPSSTPAATHLSLLPRSLLPRCCDGLSYPKKHVAETGRAATDRPKLVRRAFTPCSTRPCRRPPCSIPVSSPKSPPDVAEEGTPRPREEPEVLRPMGFTSDRSGDDGFVRELRDDTEVEAPRTAVDVLDCVGTSGTTVLDWEVVAAEESTSARATWPGSTAQAALTLACERSNCASSPGASCGAHRSWLLGSEREAVARNRGGGAPDGSGRPRLRRNLGNHRDLRVDLCTSHLAGFDRPSCTDTGMREEQLRFVTRLREKQWLEIEVEAPRTAVDVLDCVGTSGTTVLDPSSQTRPARRPLHEPLGRVRPPKLH